MRNGTKNIGAIDRMIRAIMGAGLVLFAWNYNGPFIIAMVSTVLSIALLLSALTGFCFLIRIKTNARKHKVKSQ